MKKISLSLIISFILIGYANNIYATTTSTLVKNETSSFGKFILVLIGFLLVSLVLFIGYKMDKAEPIVKQKKKKEDEGNEISDIYSAIKEKDIKYEEEKEEIYEDEIENIEYEEDDDISLYSSFKEDLYDEEDDDINTQNNYQINEDYNKLDKIFEEDLIEKENINNSIDSTMIFDTDSINSKEELNSDNEIEFNVDVIDFDDVESSIETKENDNRNILEKEEINPDFLEEMEENLIESKNKRLKREDEKSKTKKETSSTEKKKSVSKKKDVKNNSTKKNDKTNKENY